MDIPEIFVEEKTFNIWIGFFFNIIAYELPDELKQITTNVERIEKLNKNVYWKAKIKSMNILFLVYRK